MMMLCGAVVAMSANAETLDPAAIVASLARPVPSATAFVELHESALLKKPLQLSGEYRRPDSDSLVREVSKPYHELTLIRGDQATLQRDGKPDRHFQLSRAPELAGLQASFNALLSGDAQALQQHYRLHAEGQASAWVLVLQPLDPAMAKRVSELRLHGGADALRCIETVPTRGEPQRSLLGTAAEAAGDQLDAQALERLCR